MGFFEILKGEQPSIIKTLLNYENAGQFGEYSTEFALTNRNLKGDFAVLKNIYLPLKNSRTTEIDVLLIHEKGIFVFESKNYSGWIFGETDQMYWTQSLQNGEKHQFYNPIRQNKTHVRALAEYLKMPVSAFVSYIVFSERCSLMKVPADTPDTVIVRRPDMLRKLRKTLHDSLLVYDHTEIQIMAETLKPLTNKSETEKQRHIDDIQTKCPFCGSELVFRNGRYGRFWGCSAYPKCKFTRQNK